LTQLFGWNVQEFDLSSIIANALYEFGNFFLMQDRIEEAENVFSLMQQNLSQDDQALFAQYQFGMARVLAARGKRAEARDLAETSFSSLQKVGNRQAKVVQAWLLETFSDS
jgi:TolA-binding protein